MKYSQKKIILENLNWLNLESPSISFDSKLYGNDYSVDAPQDENWGSNVVAKNRKRKNSGISEMKSKDHMIGQNDEKINRSVSLGFKKNNKIHMMVKTVTFL